MAFEIRVVGPAEQDWRAQWADGTLTGTPELTNMIRFYAATAQRQGIFYGGPTGPGRKDRYLSDPISTIFLLEDIFEDIDHEYFGDVPMLPPLPEGAIA